MGGERAFFLSLVGPGAGRRAGDEEDGGGRERWDSYGRFVSAHVSCHAPRTFSIRDAEPDETLPTDRRAHCVVVYHGAARARPCLEAVVERASIRPAEIGDVDVGVGRDGIVGGARAVELHGVSTFCLADERRTSSTWTATAACQSQPRVCSWE